jgi:hypothetical protein
VCHESSSLKLTTLFRLDAIRSLEALNCRSTVGRCPVGLLLNVWRYPSK